MVYLDQPSNNTFCAAGFRFRLGLDFFMALFIFNVNLFIIFAVVRHWKSQSAPHANKSSSILIINLCTADITLAVSFVYQFLPRYLCSLLKYLEHHYVPCLLRSVFILIGHYASCFALVAIAVNRYVAAVYALRYVDIMNTRRTLIMIGLTWVLATILSTMEFYWNNWVAGRPCEVIVFQPKYYEILVFSLGLLFVLGSLTTIYWRIHRVALTVHNRRTPQDLSTMQKMNTRSARTLLMILIIYAISWPPYMVAIYIKSAGYNIPITVFEVMSSITKLNYLANPFIYAFNTRPVRYSTLRTFRSLKRKLSPRISDVSFFSSSSGKTESVRTVSYVSSTNIENQNVSNEHLSG